MDAVWYCPCGNRGSFPKQAPASLGESVDVGPVVHEPPNESGKLSGDCDHGLVVALGDGELAVTTGEAELRRPGVSNDIGRQALRALLEFLGEGRTVSVAPRRLDQ